MSHRPITQKQRRRAAKAFRATLPRYFDLVQWLVEHKHAPTKRAARELILAEKVTSASHVLGVLRDQATVKGGRPGQQLTVELESIVDPRVSVDLRDGIVVA